MTLVVTLTLNPAVDKTIRVRRLKLGQVQRVHETHLDPGGKGINVSRVVDRLGTPTIAFGFLAGEIGALIDRALESEGVQRNFLHVPGQTRLNVCLFDQSSRCGTAFWDRGPRIAREALERLEDEIRPWLAVCPIFVLGGSLPPGVPETIYASYVDLARGFGVKCFIDADGEPLRRAIEAQPYLIKPNLAELECLVGRPLSDETAVVEAAREIQRRGVDVVVVSLGASGALCVEDDQAWRVIPPVVQCRSTVGSGDSLVGGIAATLARGASLLDGLRLGTAAGAATALSVGTALAEPADIARLLPDVKIEQIFEEPSAVTQPAAP